MKQKKFLGRVTRVNSWDPAVYGCERHLSKVSLVSLIDLLCSKLVFICVTEVTVVVRALDVARRHVLARCVPFVCRRVTTISITGVGCVCRAQTTVYQLFFISMSFLSFLFMPQSARKQTAQQRHCHRKQLKTLHSLAGYDRFRSPHWYVTSHNVACVVLMTCLLLEIPPDHPAHHFCQILSVLSCIQLS